MTICIAAICESGRKVVVASDRMITAGFLSLEFEHPSSKIDTLANSTVGLTAGDALANTELFRACRGMVSQFQAPSVEMIATHVKEQFVRLRQQKAEERHLAPRGLTFQGFYQEGLINRIPPDLAVHIDSEIQRGVFPLEIIIAGVDSAGAHIYGVTDPGVSECYDRLGFHAIGSGETHALLTIIGGEHAPERAINDTVFLVYEAKRKAELAQGVGNATELGIISEDGLYVVTEAQKQELRQVYDQKMSPQLEHVKKAVSGLPFTGAK